MKRITRARFYELLPEMPDDATAEGLRPRFICLFGLRWVSVTKFETALVARKVRKNQ
jgi:hypothetical protein